MYIVKALNGSSEEIIYSPETQDERPVIAAKGSFEVNEGGSMDLTLVYGHPLYDQLNVMSTYISVLSDDEEVFYGRIIAKNDATFTGQMSYQAEGALCFLKDSQVPPDARDSSGQQSSRTLTAEAFFRWCIQQHNDQVNDSRRTFTVGQITALKKSETREYQIGSYTETKNAIEQYITGVYGGYLRVRKSGNVHYIDWIEDYGRLNTQEITLGNNVLAMNSSVSADGFFTTLLPVGNGGLTLEPPLIDILTSAEMALYGRIVKPMTFGNANTTADLQKMANDYISRVQMKVPFETSIQLIDMHYLDGSIPKIRLGDRFNNIHGAVGTEFTVGHMDVDFLYPENDAFAFRNKHDIEGDPTSSSRSGISKAAGRSSGGVGLALKHYHETMDEARITADSIKILGATVRTQGENIETISEITEQTVEDVRTINGTAVIQNSREIAQVAGKFQVLTDYYDDWPEWQPNTYYNVGDKVKVLYGTSGDYYGFICVEAHTSAGEFSQEKSKWQEHHGRESVRLLDGAAFEIDDDEGSRITVGKRINDTYESVQVMVGSALWTQREKITGVVGEYEIDIDPVTGEKSLIIVNGGGMRIRYDTTEYGLYHEGNLEGGLIVNAINNGYPNARTVYFNNNFTIAYATKNDRALMRNAVTGAAGIMYIDVERDTPDRPMRYQWDAEQQKYVTITTTYETHIKGNRVIVGTVDDQTAQTMQDKFGEVDGLVAAKATIGQLNALSARVGNIEADYITTDNLATRFGQITGSLLLSGNMVVSGDGSISMAASKMTFSNTAGSTVTTRNPKDFIRNVQVIPNGSDTYKLQYQLAFDPDSTWRDAGTFNRATTVTLTGSWSGGVLTVTPSSGDPWVRTLRQTSASWTGYDVSIPVHVIRTSGQSEYDEGEIVNTFVSVPNNLRYSTGHTDGIAEEKALVRSRFALNSGTYFIESYENVSGAPAISGTSYEYELGITGSNASAKVQLQNGSGTRINDTPEISVGYLYTNGYGSARLLATWGTGNKANELTIDKSQSTSGTNTFPKTYIVTTDTAVVWDSTEGKFKATPHAYCDGAERYTGTTQYSGAIGIQFNNLQGSGASAYRTVSVLNGSTSIKTSGNLTDYGDGYSAGNTAGKNAVTLNDASWNSVSTLTSSRTVTVSTSGRPTQLSKSKTVYLTAGTWSSGSIPIYIRDGSTSGSIVAQSSVSLPSVTATDWLNTTANQWRVKLTIGGGTVYSDIKDFGTTTETYWANLTGKVWRTRVTVAGKYHYSDTRDFTDVYEQGKTDALAGIVPATVISVNDPTWYDSTSSLPSVDATLNTMGSIFNTHKNGRGYIYFNVTISGVEGQKKYRIPIGSA